MLKIEIIIADITTLDVDIIVNAANTHLLRGGGVCGAIHSAAGAKLQEECIQIGACAPGDAVLTDAYNLKAKKVVHTVGPIYFQDPDRSPELLRSCYRRSLQIADESRLRSIAFPSIGTGIYGYPITKAAPISLSEVLNFRPKNNLATVIFCCFSDSDYLIYSSLYR